MFRICRIGATWPDLGSDHATVRLIKAPYRLPSENPDPANPTFRRIERQAIGHSAKDLATGFGDRGHTPKRFFASLDFDYAWQRQGHLLDDVLSRAGLHSPADPRKFALRSGL